MPSQDFVKEMKMNSFSSHCNPHFLGCEDLKVLTRSCREMTKFHCALHGFEIDSFHLFVHFIAIGMSFVITLKLPWNDVTVHWYHYGDIFVHLAIHFGLKLCLVILKKTFPFHSLSRCAEGFYSGCVFSSDFY